MLLQAWSVLPERCCDLLGGAAPLTFNQRCAYVRGLKTALFVSTPTRAV